MKRESMGDQRGEVMTGVMVVIMVVMMLFGGMHMMHRDHRHAENRDRNRDTLEHKPDHQKEKKQHMQNDNGGSSTVPNDEEKDEQE